MTTVIENHEEDHLTNLKKELDAALLRLEDFENRSRRGNLHLRGIPETITDLTSTALFQEFVPAIPIDRL